MSLENYSPEAINELALLAKSLSDNPATRKEFLKMTKKVRPDVIIPEIDMQEQAEKAFADQSAKINNLEARLAEKEAVEETMRRREELRKKGLAQSDEDIAEIEKIMSDKGIMKHESAAEYWQYMKQAAAPTSSSFNGQPVMNKFVNLKEYFKNPVNAARNEAVNALTEIRKNPKAVGF